MPDQQANSEVISLLKRIQNGSAFLYEASTLEQFMQWWNTTTWAEQMHENLNKAPAARSGEFPNSRWNSINLTALQWSNYS